MQGYGNLFWKDGSLYSGQVLPLLKKGRRLMLSMFSQFSNNTKHGEGTLFYSSGDIFAGSWDGERKSGPGRYIFTQVKSVR